MNFESLERSNQSSKPVALYEFWVGNKIWLYAKSETAFVTNNPYGKLPNGQSPATLTYQPLNIADKGFVQNGVADNEEVEITVPKDIDVAKLFVGVPPSEPVKVVTRRGNIGTNEAPVFWIGSIKSTRGTGKIATTFICAMLIASFKRQGVRLVWQRGCPYALYDAQCKVDPANYRGRMTIESLDGSRVFAGSLSGLPQERYAGGYVEWTTDYGTIERRAIETQGTSSFGILEGTSGLKVGMSINYYPGCKLTRPSCESFNNLENYGGFEFLPGKSPFDGSPVF